MFLVVDDFGRFDANEKILRSKVYPLKENIRTTDITRFLSACEEAGLICLYTVGDKRYLSVNRFGQTRANCRSMKSKYPEPPGDVCNLQTNANNLSADANKLQASVDNLQTSAAENENENDNKKRVSLKSADVTDAHEYPQSVSAILEIAKRLCLRVTEEQAQFYLDYRSSRDWIPQGARLRISPGKVAQDLKIWVMRNEKKQAEEDQKKPRGAGEGEWRV